MIQQSGFENFDLSEGFPAGISALQLDSNDSELESAARSLSVELAARSSPRPAKILLESVSIDDVGTKFLEAAKLPDYLLSAAAIYIEDIQNSMRLFEGFNQQSTGLYCLNAQFKLSSSVPSITQGWHFDGPLSQNLLPDGTPLDRFRMVRTIIGKGTRGALKQHFDEMHVKIIADEHCILTPPVEWIELGTGHAIFKTEGPLRFAHCVPDDIGRERVHYKLTPMK